jgi:hypothetical protein
MLKGRFVRERRLAIAFALVSLLVAGCDPGWFLYGRNDSSEPVTIRFVSPSFSDVYRMAPDFFGRIYSEIGAVEALIQIIDVNCDPLQSMSAPEYGDVLVTVSPEGDLLVQAHHPSRR